MLFFNSKNFISCSLSKERKRFYFHLFLVRIRKRSHLSFGQFCASLQSPSSWPPRMIHCRCELDKESRTKVWCEAVLIFLSLVRTVSITYLYYHSSTCARLSPSHGVICLECFSKEDAFIHPWIMGILNGSMGVSPSLVFRVCQVSVPFHPLPERATSVI